MKQVTRLVKETVQNIMKPEMRVLPGQLAFFFVISLIPLIALVGAIASTFSISIDTLTTTLQEALPGNISNTLLGFITGDGLNFNIVIFFISAFVLASNGAHSMIITSNAIYKIESGGAIRRRIKAILMTFILVGLIFFLLIVPVFGDLIFEMMEEFSTNGQAIEFLHKMYSVIKYPLSILIIFINIKMLYLISPDKDIPSKTTTKGAMFTTIAWLIATEIYSVYVGTFSRYDIFYGSISNILILLLWVYILSYIFVLGMAFNASALDVEKEKNKKNKEESKELVGKEKERQKNDKE